VAVTIPKDISRISSWVSASSRTSRRRLGGPFTRLKRGPGFRRGLHENRAHPRTKGLWSLSYRMLVVGEAHSCGRGIRPFRQEGYKACRGSRLHDLPGASGEIGPSTDPTKSVSPVKTMHRGKEISRRRMAGVWITLRPPCRPGWSLLLNDAIRRRRLGRTEHVQKFRRRVNQAVRIVFVNDDLGPVFLAMAAFPMT